MSKAFDNFDFTPAPPPPFWRPFFLSMLFAAPVSLLWYYAASSNGLRLPGMSLLVGVLCALGTRVGNGEFSSTILATSIQIIASMALIALHEIAVDLDQSMAQTAAQIVLQGHFNDFCSEAFLNSGRFGIKALPVALVLAYKIQDRD